MTAGMTQPQIPKIALSAVDCFNPSREATTLRIQPVVITGSRDDCRLVVQPEPEALGAPLAYAHPIRVLSD
jgi:hypothetical protein